MYYEFHTFYNTMFLKNIYINTRLIILSQGPLSPGSSCAHVLCNILISFFVCIHRSQCINTNDKYCCNIGAKRVVKRSEEPRRSCSHWNPDGIGSRKVSKESEATQMGEFPWQVAFLKSANSNLRIECGASLIHPEVLLTSVHCVKKW